MVLGDVGALGCWLGGGGDGSRWFRGSRAEVVHELRIEMAATVKQ